MDNHEEEKEPLIAQSRAGEAGANLTDVLAALRKLATEWAQEGNFYSDSLDDRELLMSKTYLECAKQLKSLVGG